MPATVGSLAYAAIPIRPLVVDDIERRRRRQASVRCRRSKLCKSVLVSESATPPFDVVARIVQVCCGFGRSFSVGKERGAGTRAQLEERKIRLGAAGGEPSKHVREANVLGRRENCSNGDRPNAFFRDCSISFRSRLVDACKLLSLGKHHNLSLVPTFPVFNATNEALLHVLYSPL